MSSAIFSIISCLLLAVSGVPFVTKRVSLHNPITIDFSGWRPLRDTTQRQPTTDDDTQRRPLDDHFLTVPVAVETDAEHVLSESDLNMIRERVIANWRQKPLKSESFPHLRPLVDKLLPRPEVEKEVKEEAFKEEEEAASNEEFTFVKMDARNATTPDDNLFHAYFAASDHVPPPGYVRMSKREFQKVFKSAEILFV